MCEQWVLHCTSQWGQWTLLSEHVYFVAVAFEMTEQSKKFTSNFNLEHSSVETIQMIQKAAAMDNW